MKSVLKKSMLLATAFLALAGTAHASVSSVLQVKVPFPFLVGSQTFPAGKYLVQRDDIASAAMLIRGDDNNNRSARFMLTMPADGRDPAGSVPALAFTRHENQYRLSTIWLSDDNGKTVIKR